jgi:hypothetical protein
MWELLPAMFDEASLKSVSVSEKQKFLARRKIDFIDLILEVDVADSKNYADRYLDKRIIEAWDTRASINSLPALKSMLFTRKSSTDVKCIGKLASDAASILTSKGLSVHHLPTPARFINESKRAEWRKIFSEAGITQRAR